MEKLKGQKIKHYKKGYNTMVNKFFMHRAKETRNGDVDKGTETHPTYDSAKQAYHAYLGAYAYGKGKDVIFA